MNNYIKKHGKIGIDRERVFIKLLAEARLGKIKMPSELGNLLKRCGITTVKPWKSRSKLKRAYNKFIRKFGDVDHPLKNWMVWERFYVALNAWDVWKQELKAEKEHHEPHRRLIELFTLKKRNLSRGDRLKKPTSMYIRPPEKRRFINKMGHSSVQQNASPSRSTGGEESSSYDGGGDSDSDGPGDPPGPQLAVPSLQTSSTLTTPQRNYFPHSLMVHPCRWSLVWRWSA